MNGQSIRVLHVDDDSNFSDLTQAYLTQEDSRFVVETATSVAKGLESIDDDPPDCVVSDYEMPGKDGIEFLHRVREWYPDLPFVLFTGRGSEEVASEAISAGVTEYIQKDSAPEQYELLANRIKNAVSQRRAEQRARRQRRRFRTIFERFSQPVAEVEFDHDGPIVERVNPAFEGTFGYDGAEIEGRSIDSYIVPDDKADEAGRINRRVQAGESVEPRRVVRQTADGLRRFLLQTAVYGEGPAGFVIYTDITDRELRQENLERTRDLLRQTEQLASVGGWELDPVTDELRWTRGTYAIHELDPDGDFDPTLESAIGFYHPDDRPTIETATDELRTTGEAYELELRLVTAENTEKWVRTTGEAVYDDGEIAGMRGVIRDITAEKLREQELREVTSQYQALVDSFPGGGVFLFNRELEYIRAGGNELNALGLSSDNFTGRTPQEMLPGEIGEETARYYRKTLAGESHTYRQEYRGTHYEIRTMPIRDQTGEVTHGMAVSRDISHQVTRRETLKQQNERLEEFASVVSHDLRNPLTTAELRVDLAQAECESSHLDDAADAIGQCQTLIEDLLSLARGGETVGSVEPTSIAALADECWQVIPSEDATLAVETDRTIPADRGRLKQLFENLLTNAVEHGGSATTVTVGELPDGFYVADDGVGIPADERTDIFEQGYSTARGGTGFGLRIVAQIVDAHGWNIRVTDSDDGGARFEVTGVESPE